MKKSIKDLGDVKGKRALVRVDVNVPLDADKNVTDRKANGTLNFHLNRLQNICLKFSAKMFYS